MTINDLLSLFSCDFLPASLYLKETASSLICPPILSTLLCQYIGLTAILYGFKSEMYLHHFPPNCLFVRYKPASPIWSPSLSFLLSLHTPPSSLCQGVLVYLVLISASPPLAPFPSCLPWGCVYLPFSWGSPGGPLRVFVSLAQRCHSGNGSIFSWNPHCSSLSLFLSLCFFLLPSLFNLQAHSL